jgi:hypothetical protein
MYTEHIHDDLMKRWRVRFSQQLGHNVGFFNVDGIVDTQHWNDAPVKVMILNRETNAIEPPDYTNGLYSIPDAIQRSSRGKTGWTRGNTLRVSGQWAYGILNHQGGTYPLHKEAKRNAFIAPLSIAYVNLRKTNGGAVANLKVLERDTAHYADLLKEQIELINPDVVICGRTLGYIRKFIFGDEMVCLGERLYKLGTTLFIAHFHPSARKKHAEMYQRIMDDYTRYKHLSN